MPLLTPLQTINASLADDARTIAAHISAASSLANRMVQRMLALDDEQLSAWLNAQGDPTPLFTAHGQLGEALNAASNVAAAVLSESGLPANLTAVDVRSVPEKLSDQRREILTTVDGFEVVTHPEPPAEEPQPDPA